MKHFIHTEARREARELEHLVDVLGDRDAQAAVVRHDLPRLVAREQGRR